MVVLTQAPDVGDLVWLDLEPHAGREQAGRRPALVLSPSSYNRRAGLALVCPVTGQQKGYPFEVALPQDAPIAGVVLTDHLKSVDWMVRRAERAGHVSEATMEEVRGRLAALLGFSS
jgi:mRNA interferase MazF